MGRLVVPTLSCNLMGLHLPTVYQLYKFNSDHLPNMPNSHVVTYWASPRLFPPLSNIACINKGPYPLLLIPMHISVWFTQRSPINPYSHQHSQRSAGIKNNRNKIVVLKGISKDKGNARRHTNPQ